MTPSAWFAAAAGVAGMYAAATRYAHYTVGSQWLGSTVLCGGPDSDGVALTFDDGPGPATARILDVLREARAPATFFALGQQVEQHVVLARRFVDEGHEVGNHSYSHAIYPRVSPSLVRDELERTQAIVERATGMRPRMARPPCGARSRAYFRETRRLALTTVQWSHSGRDWLPNVTPAEIARTVLANVRPGAIILLHDHHCADLTDQRRVADALVSILCGIEDRGMRPVPLAALDHPLLQTLPRGDRVEVA